MGEGQQKQEKSQPLQESSQLVWSRKSRKSVGEQHALSHYHTNIRKFDSVECGAENCYMILYIIYIIIIIYIIYKMLLSNLNDET